MNPGGEVEEADRPIRESSSQVVVKESEAATGEWGIVVIIGGGEEVESGVNVTIHVEVAGSPVAVYVFIPPCVAEEAGPLPDGPGEVLP